MAAMQPRRKRFGIHRARCCLTAAPRARARTHGTGLDSWARADGSREHLIREPHTRSGAKSGIQLPVPTSAPGCDTFVYLSYLVCYNIPVKVHPGSEPRMASHLLLDGYGLAHSVKPPSASVTERVRPAMSDFLCSLKLPPYTHAGLWNSTKLDGPCDKEPRMQQP